MGREETSPYRYDRAEVRRVLETDGLAEARMRFPDIVVMPIARMLGLTRQYRPSDIWKPEWSALLGTKPDPILAAELGVATVTVGVQRRKLGIPTFSRSEYAAQKAARQEARLRSLSDVDLMRNIGAIVADLRVTSAMVKAERERRGLSPNARYHRRYDPSQRLSNLRRVCVRAMRAADSTITLEHMGAVLGITRERVRQYLDDDRVVAAAAEPVSVTAETVGAYE